MGKKKKHKRRITFQVVCGRCGNEIHPKSRCCMYCQLRIKNPDDIIRIRNDQV